MEEVLIRLTGGLHDRGHDVKVAIVLTGSTRRHPVLDALESRGVNAVPVFLPPRRYRREMSAVRELCRSFVPNVVHTHGYRPDVLHRRALASLRVPMVTTLHGFTGGGAKNRFYEWLQLRSVRSFDATVAVSSPMADRLQRAGVPAGRVHVIPNAWELRVPMDPGHSARTRLEVPAHRFHIGWIGRLSREKGPDVFVEAMRRLDDAGITASIIGDGRLRDELVARAAEVRGPELVFHGYVPDAGRLLAAFDVVVLSSRTEGTPIVLFEGMAAGVPVVATTVGGIPDVVGPDSAYLVPPEDPEALAEAIRAVHRNPGEARRRALRAQALLDEKHAVGPWLDRYERLYADLVDQREFGRSTDDAERAAGTEFPER